MGAPIGSRERARYWELRASGWTQSSAAAEIGAHVNTVRKWERDTRYAKAENASLARSIHIDDSKAAAAMSDAANEPRSRKELSNKAKRALEDFDYFRRRYLGRCPSPWQVDAAYKIVDLLHTDEREFLILNCPPGAGKSTLWHDIAVWMIVRDRSIRILIGSVSSTLANQYSARIRDTLERTAPVRASDYELRRGLAMHAEATLAEDYGRFRPLGSQGVWRRDEFIVEQFGGAAMNNKEPTVAAYGMESEFIGHRANLCLFDDAANPENARESAARDRLLERWDNVAEARCEPGGLFANIGQRLSPTDLTAHCLSKRAVLDDADSDQDGEPLETPQYHHLVYKAYYPELDTGKDARAVNAEPWPKGPLLDPRRIPWRDLQMRKAANPRSFAIVYQQEDPDTQYDLIHRTWVYGGLGDDGILYPGCLDKDRKMGTIPHGLHGDIISIATVDPSPSQYWAVEWWLYQPATELRYLIDVTTKRMSAEELLGYDLTEREHRGLMVDWQERSVELGRPITHWVVEVNAAQRFLLAHDFVRKWIAKTGVAIVPHTTGMNKLNEELGVEALLKPLFKSGRVRLPFASSGGSQWPIQTFIAEHTSWRPDKKANTDTVMACWFAELHWPKARVAKAPPRQWRPEWVKSMSVPA